MGKPLERGYLDARKSATALLGFDKSLRYFVAQQDEELAREDYPIPVRIQAGSWEALIPHDIPSWLVTALGAAGTAYLVTAAKKMAENDFRDASLRGLFKKSLEAMQWVLRIGKHLGSISKRKFVGLRFRSNNTEIGIPNERGEYLFVPKYFFELFEKVPANLLKDVAAPVTADVDFEVVVRDEDEDKGESLTYQEKGIFCPEEEEILFPELVDGSRVELRGLVTRGNENTNTIGFEYKGHIVTCEPRDGDVVPFKPALFVTCDMVRTVKRGKKEDGTLARPRIVFSTLVPCKADAEGTAPRLFDDDENDG